MTPRIRAVLILAGLFVSILLVTAVLTYSAVQHGGSTTSTAASSDLNRAFRLLVAIGGSPSMRHRTHRTC